MVRVKIGHKDNKYKEKPPEGYKHKAGGRLLWGWITTKYPFSKKEVRKW